MKISIIFSVIFLSCLILFQSCLMTYGDYVHNDYTPIERNNLVTKSDNIYLFFNGESIDFKYKKIGLIECQGDQYSKNGVVLDHFKYQAWKNNANAIINITDGRTIRETGTLMDSTPDRYLSKVYKGIAVAIDIDSAFIAKYGNEADTTFITHVRELNRAHNEKQEGRFFTSIFATLLGIAIVAVIVLMDKEEVGNAPCSSF